MSTACTWDEGKEPQSSAQNLSMATKGYTSVNTFTGELKRHNAVSLALKNGQSGPSVQLSCHHERITSYE